MQNRAFIITLNLKVCPPPFFKAFRGKGCMWISFNFCCMWLMLFLRDFVSFSQSWSCWSWLSPPTEFQWWLDQHCKHWCWYFYKWDSHNWNLVSRRGSVQKNHLCVPATKGHSVYDGKTHSGWLVSTLPMLFNGVHTRKCVTKY